jgi:hypothetical protein
MAKCLADFHDPAVTWFMANSTNNQRRSDVPAVVISVATALAWGSLFSLPKRTGLAIVCGLLFMIGFWSVLFPSRLIDWAAPIQAGVDATDQRWWWIARTIGLVLMLMSAATVIAIY